LEKHRSAKLICETEIKGITRAPPTWVAITTQTFWLLRMQSSTGILNHCRQGNARQ